MTTLLSKWVPKRERGTLGSLVLTGPQVGSITTNLLTAYIIAVYKQWEIVFYFWGLLALVWYVFYMFMCFSEPSTHPFITADEKEMLGKEIRKVSVHLK